MMGSKPVKIAFEDNELFNTVSNFLQDDKIVSKVSSFLHETNAVQRSTPNLNPGALENPLVHLQWKKTDEVMLTASQLQGITLKLVQEKGDTRTTATADIQFRAPSIPPSKLEVFIWFFLGLLVLFIVSTFLLPFVLERKGVGAWPISTELAQRLRWNLHDRLKEPQYTLAAGSISDAIEFHDGSKALTLHLVGNVAEIANITVQAISKALFGSDLSDRVLFVRDKPASMLKVQIFRQLKSWPLSVVILDYQNIAPSHADFLTSALDGGFPQLELNDDSVKTNQAIFVFVSEMLEQEVAQLQDGDRLGELYNLVKERMKQDGWPDRICQRVDNVIPFF